MTGYFLAEFPTARALVAAARIARQEGHPAVDALTPHPVEEVEPELTRTSSAAPVGWVMFIAGSLGAILGYFMQWFSAVVDYPVISGNRPLHSWQVFLLVPYETAILSAAIAGVLGWMYMCGLLQLHHPLFDARVTLRASQDRYLLVFRDAGELKTWASQHLKPLAVHELRS